MVEITLILHGYQSKFEVPDNQTIATVISNLIYVQFLSNGNYLEGHIVTRYGDIFKKLRKHQSKNLMNGQFFLKKNLQTPR